jgi:hypothetical protein
MLSSVVLSVSLSPKRGCSTTVDMTSQLFRDLTSKSTCDIGLELALP